jgi:hypothetical protein
MVYCLFDDKIWVEFCSLLLGKWGHWVSGSRSSRKATFGSQSSFGFGGECIKEGACHYYGNFFTSVGFFQELASRQIYATCTIWSNWIGLPLALKNTNAFRNISQVTLEWRMHKSCQIASVLWKDKKPVLLLSTHANSIGYPCMLVPTILRRNGTVREDIMTSPMLLEYTTHICGVDGWINCEHHIVRRIARITSTRFFSSF